MLAVHFLHLHKLFLCRSPYFKKMLASNFKEGIEGVIDFAEFNKDAIFDIMGYLYTDRLDSIKPDNCISILLYSLQFSLPEISNFCRKIVKEYFSLDNICQVLKLADFYNDSSLKMLCLKYAAMKYEEVSTLSEFSSVSTSSKDELFALFQKRKKKDEKKREQSIKYNKMLRKANKRT